MKKSEVKAIISSAAKAHAEDILGEEQFKKNKSARESIMKDFESGASWMYHFNLDKTRR
ncbi:hypothetical protein [Epilithonimonas mollis]|uniref:Uncharacterized protein n=1 Tax=Epilithonimonas mollis TaxID=216903 RepID=A0A1M6UJN2_9FLAO|nr:hypothetical protein [Epilithonimonas mollis]SHK69376.1 hypothetical protein SAMN05444371_3330 [Epilithonimonas mollis]